MREERREMRDERGERNDVSKLVEPGEEEERDRASVLVIPVD